MQRGMTPAIWLILISIVLVFGIFILPAIDKPKKNVPTPSPTGTPKPDPYSLTYPSLPPSPLPTPEPKSQVFLYSASGNSLDHVTEFSDLSPNKYFGFPAGQMRSDGTVFFNDSKTVFQYNLNSKAKETVLNADQDYLLARIDLIEPDNLSTTEIPADYYSSKPTVVIEKNLTTGDIRKIDSVKHVLNGSVNYLFKASDGEDIVGSFGAADCGQYGAIYKVQNNGKPTEYLVTGGGCNRKPLFIGSYESKDQLVLLSLQEDWNKLGPDNFDTLYLKNVVNGQETPLFDFKSQKKRLTSYTFNNTQKKVAMFFDDGQIFFYQLEDQKLVGPLNLGGGVKNFFSWKGNLATSIDTVSKNISIVNTDNLTIKKYSYKGLGGTDNNGVYLLGSFQGQPILYSVHYPD